MIIPSILSLAAALAAPGQAPATSPAVAALQRAAAGHHAAPTRAIAVVHPTQGNNVEGTVRFAAGPGGVKITASLKGLAPGTHGFHVHEFGDCSAPDGASAGGHFNPAGNPHAGPRDGKRHAGDLGNVEAAADGTATLDWTDAQMKLDGPHGVLGHAVIVHAKADDLKTQPTGDAGGRLACGVIGIAKPE